MDTLTTIAGTTSILIVIFISLIPFILLCVIAYRLKLIVNTTFKSSKIPGVNHYAEARANEIVGDKKEALKYYYLAYWALSETDNSGFKWMKDEYSNISVKNKISLLEEELTGKVPKKFK